jgi:hypothetical protein
MIMGLNKLFYLFSCFNLHFVLYFLQFFYCNLLLFKAILQLKKTPVKA